MKTIILIDQVNNKKKLLYYLNNNNTYVLPLNIKTKLFCEKNKLPRILSTNKYFQNLDHKLALKLSHDIKKLIRLNIKKSSLKLNKYNSFIIWLSNLITFKYFNKNIFKILIIRNVVKSKEFQKIIFISQSKYILFENGLIKNLDNFTFEHYSEKKSVNFLKILYTKINNLLVYLYCFTSQNNFSNKVLLSSINYNLTKIISNKKKIFLADQQISFWTIIKLYFKKNIITKIIHTNKNFYIDEKFYETVIQLFTTKSNLLKKIIDPSINYQVEEISKEILNIEYLFDNFIKKIKNSSNYYYVSPFSFGLSGLIGEYLSNINFKSLCIPHGTVKSDCTNIYEKIYNSEIAESIIDNNFSHIAIQSKLSLYAFNSYNNFSKKVLTQPICFSSVNSYSNNINVLLASTFKNESNMKFFGVETFDEYFESVKDLIETFKDKKINLIFQPHPTLKENLSNDDLLKLFQISSNNIKISNQTFIENLKKTSILISFSSTVIEEALLSNIPVIIYDKWNRYNHLDKFKDINDKFINYFNSAKMIESYLDNYKFDNIKYLKSFNKFNVKFNKSNIEDLLQEN